MIQTNRICVDLDGLMVSSKFLFVLLLFGVVLSPLKILVVFATNINEIDDNILNVNSNHIINDNHVVVVAANSSSNNILMTNTNWLKNNNKSHVEYEDFAMNNVNQNKLKACPPMETVHPCKCLEHSDGLFFRIMLACNGTEIKHERQLDHIIQRIGKKLTYERQSTYFDWVYLLNFENVRKITRHFFSSISFRYLVIENAPALKQIHPSAFKSVNNHLRYFYAYNTALDAYRRSPTKAPFNGMRHLIEVHIVSKSNICPPKEIIFPCECHIRIDTLMPFHIKRQILQLRCINQKGRTYNVAKIFNRLTKLIQNINFKPRMWYFDEVILRNVSELNEKVFGDIDFSELHIENSEFLRFISRRAFSPESTIQKLRISGANFLSDKLMETFEAINGLKYLRSLHMWSCVIDFIPEYAFSNEQPFLKDIVLYGNNIRAIGSYAFVNLNNIEELRIDGNNLLLIDKYAFTNNLTNNRPLHLTLASNNLIESSFSFMAFGAQRPLHLSFAETGGCYWNIKFLDEQIFAPFLIKNANRLYLEPECQLKCSDCRMRWLTEIPKQAQRRLLMLSNSNYGTLPPSSLPPSNFLSEGYVPCEEGGNFFDIFEILNWENCIN